MKVYLLSKVPVFTGTASASRFKCYAKALLATRCSPKLIMYRYYSKGGNNKNGLVEGVPFSFVGIQSSMSYPSIIRKALSVLNEVIVNLYLICVLKKGDIVFFFDEELFWGKFLIFSTHLKKAKFVAEICEFPYGRGEETESTKKNRKRIEKEQFPKYDGAVVISEALRQYMMPFVRNESKVIRVPIMVDINNYLLEDKSGEIKSKYIFHSGTLFDQKDGIIGMIEAFGIACQRLNKTVRFISTGTLEKSPHAKPIKEIIKKYSLENNVIFTGYVEDEVLKDYLAKATAVIINKKVNQQNTYCFSTKLGEYAAAGKIIIISKIGEACNWLNDGNDSLFYEPGDIDSLSENIVHVFSEPQKYNVLGKNAQETAKKHFDYRVYSQTLEKYFISL